MKRIISIFLTLICLVTFVNPVLAMPQTNAIDINVLPAPEQEKQDDIELEAQSAILIGLKNGETLFSKNEDEKLYPASTTKILTGLLALENGDLDEMIVVGNEANLCPKDSSIAGLDIKEEITLKNLMYGLMLPSGNDAAYTIAVYIGRKVKGDPTLSISEAVKVFTDLMNRRAQELGATNSHFVNPDGYHDDDHYTTTHDMALIASEAMKNDVFRRTVSTTMFTIPDWSSLHDPEVAEEEKETRYWRNSNLLIQPKDKFFYPDATGVKTGYTSKAMHCLVASASRNDMEILAVVFGSSKNGKWADSTALLDYGFNNFEIYEPFSQGQQIDTLKVTNNPQSDWVKIIADETPTYFIPKGQRNKIAQEIKWHPDITLDGEGGNEQISLPAPIAQSQKVGTLTIKLDGKPLDEIDLVASRAVRVNPPKESKLPTKLQDGPKASYSIHWSDFSPVQKFGVLGAGLFLLVFVLWVRAARRRRRRYSFRRRY